MFFMYPEMSRKFKNKDRTYRNLGELVRIYARSTRLFVKFRKRMMIDVFGHTSDFGSIRKIPENRPAKTDFFFNFWVKLRLVREFCFACFCFWENTGKIRKSLEKFAKLIEEKFFWKWSRHFSKSNTYGKIEFGVRAGPTNS